MGSSAARIVLAQLFLAGPLLAQARPAGPVPGPEPDEPVREEVTLPVVVEGVVLLPDGRPAAGAVVVSSAGGSAEVRGDGRYMLEARVSPGVEHLQLTAVASGPTGSLRAQRIVRRIVPRGTTSSEPLYLTSSSGCTPDWIPTFGPQPGVGGMIRAFAVFDDGTGAALYAAGSIGFAGGHAVNSIAKWDGNAWSPLGSGVDPWVYALTVFDDGFGEALYAAGSFTSAGGQPANRIAKWDGSAWSPLGSGADGTINALTVFDGGSGPALYAGGAFTSAGGQDASRIAKWDGSAWSPLGSGVGGTINALTVFDDGSGEALYAGGLFTSAGDQAANRIARWDGTAWSALGSGVGSTVEALAVFDDGSGAALYVAGNFTTAGGQPANRIARWDGSAWSPLGSGIGGPSSWFISVRDLEVFDDGSGAGLYAGGQFTTAGGQAASRIARWDASGWSALSGHVNNSWVHALKTFDDGYGAALYVGGSFISMGGQQMNMLAKWDGSAWSAIGDGVSRRVQALTVFDDGSSAALYVGGDFWSAGGQTLNRIGSWNGSTWSPLGSGISNVSQFDWIRALAIFDDGTGDALHAGGSFFNIGGQSTNGIGKWDGSAWSWPGQGLGLIDALAVYDDGSGEALYAGGSFYAGSSTFNIAKWDGSAWSRLGSGVVGNVSALAVYDDGSGPALYVGGGFYLAGGQPASRIARWDGSGWSPLGSGLAVTSGVYASALSLAVWDDGSGEALYVGGAFTVAGGQQASKVARWDGNAWSPLGVGMNDTVSALAVHDDGSGEALYAGGLFTVAGGGAANRIAKWDGTAWSPLGSGVSGDVYALAVFDDGSGPALHVGGHFLISPGGDSHLAKWGCGVLGTAYCFGDGSGTACPCGNAGAAGEGCANSTGQGAVLSAAGSASVVAADLVLASANLPPGQPGLFFQGNAQLNGGAGLAFGDGLRCAGVGVVRLEVVVSDAGGSSSTTLDVPSAGGVSPGDTRRYQHWYRDALASPCGTGFNLSNGLELVWAP